MTAVRPALSSVSVRPALSSVLVRLSLSGVMCFVWAGAFEALFCELISGFKPAQTGALTHA